MATFFGQLLPKIDTRAEKIVSGDNHNVLLTHDGKVYTWGDNIRGQLGNGTTTNSSTGTIVNPVYLENPNGYSIFFDGGNNVVNFTASSQFAISANQNFTLECWVYLSSSRVDYAYMVDFIDPSSNILQLRIGNAGFGYRVQAAFGPGASASSVYNNVSYTQTNLLNRWTHLALCRSGDSATFFFDGVGIETKTGVSGITISTPTTAARLGRVSPETFHGYISNVRFVQNVALYTANFTPAQSPLTSTFNTVLLIGQNSTFKDNSINGVSLTVSGNATPSTISPFNYSLKRNLYADVSAASSTTAAISFDGELLMWGNNSSNQIGITSSTSVTTPVNFTALKLSNPTAHSVYFDGNGDYLDVLGSSGFSLVSGNYTIEAWIYVNSLATNRTIVQKDWTSGITYPSFLLLVNTSGNLYFNIGSGTASSSGNFGLTSTITITLNTWHHVAVVKSGTTITLYINGTNSASGTQTVATGVSTTNIKIGYSNSNSDYMLGYISNLRILQGTDLYTTNFIPSTVPLTAITNTGLLTCQSPTIIDNSVNNFIITANGNSKPVSSGPFNVGFENVNWKSVSLGVNHTLALSADNDVYAWGNNASGQLGNGTTTSNYIPQLVGHISSSSYSVLFDGSGDYLTFNGIPLTTDTTQFTIEAWIYPTSNANQSYIYAQFTGADARRTTFYRETDTTINFFHPDIGTNVVKSGATPNNAWMHVAVTRDSSNTVRLFVNGNIAYTHNNFTNYPQQTNAQIGGVGASYFVGYISNLRVVKNVAVYTSNFTPSRVPLTATAQTTLLTCQDFNINDLSSSNFKLSASFGDVQVSEFSPFRVQTKFSKVCAGNGYSLALSTDGKLYAWGENSSGQLGIGNTTDQTTPVVVKNPIHDYSVYFDGSGDWISVVDSGGLLAHGPNNFTYECWIKPSGSFSAGYVIHQYGSVIDGINISVNSTTGVVTANIRATNQASIDLLSPSNSVQIGKWNHVAIMRNGATLVLAVNGLVYSSAISAATLFLENQNSLFTPLRFGSKSNLDADYFKGYISNVRIIRGRALYTTNYTIPTAPFTVTYDTVFLGLQSNRLVDTGPFNLKITATGNSTVFAQGPFEGSGYKWLDFNAGSNHTLFASSNNQLFATGDNTNGKLGDSTTATSNVLVETFVNTDRSVYFNGSSYLTSTLTGTAPGTGEFTYECWFFVDSLAATEGIFNTRSGATADGFNVFISTTGLITVGHTSTLFTAGAKATVYASKWYHFAIIRVGTTVKVYLNYGLIGSFTDSTNFSSTTLNIGCTAQGANIFNGYISNFRYLNYALYNDDGYGIPNSYSVYFDGTGDMLTVSNLPGPLTGDFTYECWAYPTNSTVSYRAIFGIDNYGASTPFRLYQYGTIFEFWFTGTSPNLRSSNTITMNRWYHLAITRSGTSIRFFVNGEQMGTTVTSNANYPTSNFRIGMDSGSLYPFIGYISNVRVVNGAALYTSDFISPTSVLTAIANTVLLTCQSSTIKDSSTNNFTITVSGESVARHFNPFGNLVIQPLTAITGTRFLSCQGTTIVDNSTNKFTITSTGTPVVSVNSPFRSLMTAKNLAAGENHSLVIDKNSTLRSWGSNSSGQLGTTTEYAPINLYETNVYSVYFDGNNDYLTAPSNAAFTLDTGNFTIEAWVNRQGLNPVDSNFVCIIADFRTVEPSTQILIEKAPNSTALELWVNGSSRIISTTTLTQGQWIHFALVRSSGVTRLYINGIKEGVDYTDTNNYTSSSLVIGGRFAAVTGDFRSWNGYISNLRIVKGTALYTANFTPPTSALTAVANTSLLTCQDATFKDNSVNNFTITTNGNVYTTEFAPDITGTSTKTLRPRLISAGKEHSAIYAPSRISNRLLAAGKNDIGQLGDNTLITKSRFVRSQIPLTYSVYYDGASDYLIYSNSTAFGLGTGNFTIELWSYVSTIGDNNWIIDLRTAGGGSGQVKPQIAIFTGGGIGYYYGASVSIAATSASLITPNTWNHIAVVRNSGTSKIYLNGIERASAADTLDFGASATVTLGTVGDSPGFETTEFTGYMSNVRLVKGTAVYTSNFTPPTAPLSAIPGTSLLVCQDSTFNDNSINNFTASRTGEIRTDVFNPFGYLT